MRVVVSLATTVVWPLYGINFLIEGKKADLENITGPMSDTTIRLREEVAEQIKALYQMIDMGKAYGLDLSRPAENGREAVQWTYMAYLAAVKEQDGAAMVVGKCFFILGYLHSARFRKRCNY